MAAVRVVPKGWRNGGDCDQHVIVYFKNVVQAFEARWTQLGGKIVDRRELRDRRRTDVVASGQPTERRRRGRRRHIDGSPWASDADDRERAPVARQQVADPQLVGGRRHVLGPKEPVDLNYYFVTYRVGLRGRSRPGGERAREEGQGGDRWVRHRCGRDRRRRNRDQSGEVDPGTAPASQRRSRSSRRCPTISGLVSFTPQLALGLRSSVPRAQHREQQGEDGRHGRREGRPEDLGRLGQSSRRQANEDRWPGDSLRATGVSRSFEGVQALDGVDLEAPRPRGRGPDRPERRGQVDARQRSDRLRPRRRGLGRARADET